MEQGIPMPRDRKAQFDPTAFFKERLAQRESMADPPGSSVARLVRKAIDTFVSGNRTTDQALDRGYGEDTPAARAGIEVFIGQGECLLIRHSRW